MVEVGSPAEHLTIQDPHLTLPTHGPADREWAQSYGGPPQTFLHHVDQSSAWISCGDGWEQKDTGIGVATRGLGACIVKRPAVGATPPHTLPGSHKHELMLRFVQRGHCVVCVGARTGVRLGALDSIIIAAGEAAVFRDASNDFEMIEVCIY